MAVSHAKAVDELGSHGSAAAAPHMVGKRVTRAFVCYAPNVYLSVAKWLVLVRVLGMQWPSTLNPALNVGSFLSKGDIGYAVAYSISYTMWSCTFEYIR
jgi:hypothetical protein